MSYCWTDEKRALLLSLRDDYKLSWPRIGQALNLTTERARVKYNELKGLAFEHKKRGARPAEAAQTRITQAVRPRAVTLSQAILGDPPPGRSALDRKQESEGRAP